MKIKMKLTFLITCILGIQIMVAQTTQVSGKITDAETGDPLIVAQVFVKGTFVGTTTDDQGAFTIEANAGDILMVAYIGYKTKEVAFGEGVMNIALEPDVLRQDEVVVTGLATSVKRRNRSWLMAPMASSVTLGGGACGPSANDSASSASMEYSTADAPPAAAGSKSGVVSAIYSFSRPKLLIHAEGCC